MKTNNLLLIVVLFLLLSCSSNSSSSSSNHQSPDLVISLLKANSNMVFSGETFTLAATIKNNGNASSGSTFTTFYKSSDGVITNDDIPVSLSRPILDLAGGNNTTINVEVTEKNCRHLLLRSLCCECE